MSESPFHSAELAIQKRLNIIDATNEYGHFIHQNMPPQHRKFLSTLSFVILSLVDKQGCPWAIPLLGDAGFISSYNDTSLRFDALPEEITVFDLSFSQGQKIGILGLQLSNRRRNRINGVIDNIDQTGFSIHVEQSFENGPQYIQTRKLAWTKNNPAPDHLIDIKLHRVIDKTSKKLIEKADTFFIASRNKQLDHDIRNGLDASHRGGKPGFVKVENGTVYFPDYSGNRFFNTLGNIESDGRVGLFFPDFSTGDAVFMTGKGRIIWDKEAITKFKGAERIIEVSIQRTTYIPCHLPMTGELIEQSPVLDNTGIWNRTTDQQTSTYQPFEIISKQKESDTITSFYLASSKKSAIKNYIPGQFLPIQLNLPNEKKSISRNYTLSRAPVANSYRISVKCEPNGLASKSLHHLFNVGDTIKVGQPSGQFILQKNNHAIVMLSAGVGITPMIAMLDGFVNDVKNGAEPQPVWFIHGTQNSKTQAFSHYLNTLSREHSWLKVQTLFSNPLTDDVIGNNHYSQGRITIELLKKFLSLASRQYNFYLCGPEPFMRTLYVALIAENVAKTAIFYEFFGSGSIEKTKKAPPIPIATQAKVTFAKSNAYAKWTPEQGTLLEFAESQGLTPAYGCRAGICGTCACKLSEGEITYLQSPDFVPQQDEILICCAQPAIGSTSITIDI